MATVATVIGDFPRFIAQLVLFAIVLSAGWVALTRSGWERTVAAVVAVAALVAAVVLQVVGDDRDLISLGLRIVGLLVALGLAHYAIGTTTKALRGRPCLRPRTACCS